MDRKWSRLGFDKLEFIIHKTIVGIILWIIGSVFISYQQYVVNNIENELINILLYSVPILIISWFNSINRKKNQWKPFGKNSGVIEMFTIGMVLVGLISTIGTLKVVF